MTDRKQNRFNAAAILFSFGIVFLICIICSIQKRYAVAITDAWQLGYETGLAVEHPIPTIEDWQRRLGCEKIDGKLSPDWRNSETQAKWEEALCNQYTVEVFEGEKND